MIYLDQLVTHTERIYDGHNPCTKLTIHDTDNTGIGANAQAHANLQSDNNVRQASWHEQVDDTQAIRSYRPSARCWHAGDYVGNTTSYSIELCVNADGDLATAISNLIRVTVRRLRELNLTYRDIVDHSHWSGKHCPRVFRDNPGSWDRFIQAVRYNKPFATILQGGTMSKFSSPLPVGCRSTSPFGMRTLNGVRALHAGHDWGPPRPGQTGIPVIAVHDGTITATGFGQGRANDRIPYHSGRFAFLDIGVHGGDRMRVYYGHLASLIVKQGQRVKAGQVIGYMGGSGPRGENSFAIHLHFGVSVNHNRPVNRWNASSNAGWTDPLVWLRSKGINVGVTQPGRISSVKPVSTTPKPSTPSTGGSSNYVSKRTTQPNVPVYANRGSDKRQVGTASRKGYRMNTVKVEGSWTQVRWNYDGAYRNAWVATAHLEGGTSTASSSGPRNTTGVSTLRIQQDLNRYVNAGLVEDGSYGTVTDNWVKWTQQLQRALRAYRGVSNTLPIDGHYGSTTADAVKTLQSRNGLYQDGWAGAEVLNFMRRQGSTIPNPPSNRP